MGGGLMQLVAYGAQDVYLTGNPQITFFKVVYRRHTNFAVEAIEQTFNGSADFGRKATVQITRNGDLVTKMYLKSTLTATTGGDDTVYTNVSDEHGVLASRILPTATTTTITVTAAGNISEQVEGNGVSVYSAVFNEADGDIASVIQVGDYVLATVAAGATSFSGGYRKIVAVEHTIVQDSDLGTTNDICEIFIRAPSGLTTGATAAVDAFVHKAMNGATGRRIGFVENVGHALISDVELQIGGTKIDKHYGLWMTIWDELSRNDDMNKARDANLGNHPDGGATNLAVRNLFVPLQFSCCRNDGLALPLIALQYHDVRLEFNFATAATVQNRGRIDFNSTLSNTSLLVDYIYLDSEERKRFAQASHEYLIEQLQYTGAETLTESVNNKKRLNFNHPCKEIIWATKSTAGRINEHAEFDDLTSTAILKLNGHDRFSSQSGQYFNSVQTQQHHSRAPKDGIYCYSFALNPEEHQPSGSCNFSRIDNAELNITANALIQPGTAAQVHIYAVNYNVLRIMSGMGGLAYSN
jgi:hypothetical protein